MKARAGAMAIALLSLLACSRAPQERLPRGLQLEREGIFLRPESERLLDTFIIGLDPYGSRYFELPGLDKNPGVKAAEWLELKKQLYWLNFELSHGTLMRLLPGHTHVFVAVPLNRGASLQERESELFTSYLRERCGWDQDDLRLRLHFFHTPNPLIWLQDSGEILGTDKFGRKVVRVDAQGRPEYRKTIEALVQSYPQFFQLKLTNEGVRAEGGDEELIWLPGQKLGVISGKNRVRALLKSRHPDFLDGSAVSDEGIREAEEAFSRTFYGLPAAFIPAEILKHPELGTDELFHLDMMVAVMRNERGLHAFVPEYQEGAADAVSGQALDGAMLEACGREYDATARQMKAMGFTVLRVPLKDHPARSPVNIVKFYSDEEGKYVVYLARYPRHLPLSDEASPQRRLMKALWDLQEIGGRLKASGRESGVAELDGKIKDLWALMKSLEGEANPEFDAQAKVYQDAGYKVIPVPIYPTGSGGLHCMVLR